jgi:hypothetical protein
LPFRQIIFIGGRKLRPPTAFYFVKIVFIIKFYHLKPNDYKKLVANCDQLLSPRASPMMKVESREAIGSTFYFSLAIEND